MTPPPPEEGGRAVPPRNKAPAESAPVRIVLDDGTELPQRGRLLFSDLTVDPTSAQVTLRTEVANPQARLLPGMYVRTRLVQGQITGAMLLPQQAVTRGPQGDTVLVIGEGGQAARIGVQFADGILVLEPQFGLQQVGVALGVFFQGGIRLDRTQRLVGLRLALQLEHHVGTAQAGDALRLLAGQGSQPQVRSPRHFRPQDLAEAPH